MFLYSLNYITIINCRSISSFPHSLGIYLISLLIHCSFIDSLPSSFTHHFSPHYHSLIHFIPCSHTSFSHYLHDFIFPFHSLAFTYHSFPHSLIIIPINMFLIHLLLPHSLFLHIHFTFPYHSSPHVTIPHFLPFFPCSLPYISLFLPFISSCPYSPFPSSFFPVHLLPCSLAFISFTVSNSIHESG